MLLWQMILRDADTLLSSPEAAWGWFDKYAPPMWVKGDGKEDDPRTERLWTAESWEECCNCVRLLKELVRLKEDPGRIPEPLTGFITRPVSQYISRHTRDEFQAGPEGLHLVKVFLHWPGGQRAGFYGESGYPNDCPGAFWAYVFLSVVDQQVVPLRGGGHCEDCGKLLGMTPGGKPRTGLCAACRQRLHRSQNPEGAKQANRIHNKNYRGRKSKQKRKRKNTPPTGGN